MLSPTASVLTSRLFGSFYRLLFHGIQLNSKHNVYTIKSSAACNFPKQRRAARSLISSLTPPLHPTPPPRLASSIYDGLLETKPTWRHYLLPNMRPRPSPTQNQNDSWTHHQRFCDPVLWQLLPVQDFCKSMAMRDLLVSDFASSVKSLVTWLHYYSLFSNLVLFLN